MRIRIGNPSFTLYALSAANWPSIPLFPPRKKTAFHKAVLYEILQERAVSSRHRRNPRGVKRKMGNFPLRGFLRCSECGTPLTGGPSRSHTGKTYDCYHCYKCRAVKSIPANRTAGEFLELLKRLRVNESFTAEFAQILGQEWNSKTGDSAALVRKLNGDLEEKRVGQQKLFMKYVNDDPKILPYFEPMNRKFEDEIATLEAKIAEADMVEATFAQLWEFSKSLLVDISAAWEQANVDQKQRVQNILFSGGLKYHPEKGILNPNAECLFNQMENFCAEKCVWCAPRDSNSRPSGS